jgi:uncharacterized protein (DUF1800 family)
MPDLLGAAVAASRFGLGARPGELAMIAGDPRGWVKAQLAGAMVEPPAIAALPPCEDDMLAYGRVLLSRRLREEDTARVRQQAERLGVSASALEQFGEGEGYRAQFAERMAGAVSARLEAALTSPFPARERLVHFWSNHFTVSNVRRQSAALPPSFEREAIRSHIAGRFSEMLRASCGHPGMLVYLDNWISIGPNSVWARNPRQAPRFPGVGRPEGLNENLAREVLELHTLGVNGGYTQADVQGLAAMLTGWTHAQLGLPQLVAGSAGRRSGPALFVFAADGHEPGAKTLLGQSFRQSGVDQAEAALEMLARQPSTARFIATKLARHYVADQPPGALVDRLAAEFMRTDGDLQAVFFALVDSPEAWEAPLAKFKRPEEYLIGLLRGCGLDSFPGAIGAAALEQMGQRPYAAPGPNGWSDEAAAWLNANLVWKRIEFAQGLAARLARADVSAQRILDAALGPLASPQTREAIARADSPVQAMTLAFASPELQRR